MDLDQFEGHTPGPWEAKEKREHESLEGSHWIRCHEGALGYWRGHKPGHMDCRWVLTEKDARLIAAAPDLLAEVRRLTAEADALRRERDELAARLAEIERWKRIAENAQAVTAGGNDKLDYFEVPAHLMAALALALDEWPGAQGQAGAASMSIEDAMELHAIADGTKIRPPPRRSGPRGER